MKIIQQWLISLNGLVLSVLVCLMISLCGNASWAEDSSDNRMNWSQIMNGANQQQPDFDPSDIEWAPPYEPGERAIPVKGDPDLADLVNPGERHVPAPQGDPDLADLVKNPQNYRRTPTPTVIDPKAPPKNQIGGNRTGNQSGSQTRLQPGSDGPNLGQGAQTRINNRIPTPTTLQPGSTGPNYGQGSETRITSPQTSLQPGSSGPNYGQGSTTKLTPPAPSQTTLQPGSSGPNMGQGSQTRMSSSGGGNTTRIGTTPSRTVIDPQGPIAGGRTPLPGNQTRLGQPAPSPSGGAAQPNRPSISDFAPQIDPSQVQMPGRYQPGERVVPVSGDPGLADLVNPDVKHVPRTPSAFDDGPDLGALVRQPPPERGPIDWSGGKSPSGASSGSGAAARPSINDFAPQVDPADVKMPGRYQPGERPVRVSGDPDLADLAQPGVKHIKGPQGDPDLADLVNNPGGKKPPGGGGSTPTNIDPDGPGPRMGQGSQTRVSEPGGGGKRSTYLDEGKSSFAPEQPGIGEQIMTGVGAAGLIADPAAREMGNAIDGRRDIDGGQIARDVSGLSTYDIGKQNAEEQLQKYRDGEQSKPEAFVNAVGATADDMVLQPVRDIVRENLERMESQAEAEGRRPTMAEGFSTYINTMGEIAGQFTGVKQIANAWGESQTYEARGDAAGQQVELDQFVERNLMRGQKNVDRIQKDLEDAMYNGDPNDPENQERIAGLLDQYETEVDRLQRLQGMAATTLNDQEKIDKVNRDVDFLQDPNTMRDYAADILSQRGGELPEPSDSQPTSPVQTVDDLVARTQDSNLTREERDQAAWDLLQELQRLANAQQSGEKKDEPTGTSSGDDGTENPPVDPPIDPPTDPPKEPGTGGGEDDYDPNWLIKEIIRQQLAGAGLDGDNVDDLQDMEGGTGGVAGETPGYPQGDSSVFDQYTQSANAGSGSGYEDWNLWQAQNDMQDSSTVGDQMIRDSQDTIDAGGRESQDIGNRSAADTANADAENSWGQNIADSVEDAIISGVSGFGSSLGSNVAAEVGGEIFDGGRRDRVDNSSNDGSSPTESSPSTTAGTSNGSKSSSQTVRSGNSSAPFGICKICGKPMIRCSKCGRIHCSGIKCTKVNKQNTPSSTKNSSNVKSTSSINISQSGNNETTYTVGGVPLENFRLDKKTEKNGYWEQIPPTGPNNGQVQPTGERWIEY